MKKPNFFKFAFLSSSTGKFGEALAVSINTLMVALGATAFQIGLVNALKTLGQTFSQFIGLWFLNLFKSRKKAEIISMFIEGLPILFLAFVALTQTKYWFVIIAIIIFYSGLTGKASYLCWYSWMSPIVPKKFRDYFFGTRSFFGQVGKIVGFIIAFFVLQLNYPILILLAILFFASYVFHNVEVGTYFFHPNSKRKVLTKNHIIQRMKSTLKNKKFTNYLIWFVLLNGVLIANVLYLEFFMINKLNLNYSWIPISFILIALSSATAYYILRNYFPNISYSRKRLIIGVLVLVSCIFWLLTNSITLLIISLFVAGFSLGALTLSSKVDLINHSVKRDEEAHYAVFNFTHPLFSSFLIIFLNMFQVSQFNYSFVFYVTIPLTLISFALIKN